MKRTFPIFLLILASALFADEAPLLLPRPKKDGGKPLMKCITQRKSTRKFTKKALSEQQISDILYAACGISRPDGKRTIPTAVNCQDIVVYAVMEKGVFRFDPEKNALIPVCSGDHRKETGRNSRLHASAPLCLLYVSDKSKIRFTKDPEKQAFYGAFHAGCAQQDVALYCASENLGCVTIGSVLYPECTKLLKLGKDQTLLIGQLVGLPE